MSTMTEQSRHPSPMDPNPSPDQSPAPTLGPFDYSALPSEHADMARGAAEATQTSFNARGQSDASPGPDLVIHFTKACNRWLEGKTATKGALRFDKQKESRVPTAR